MVGDEEVRLIGAGKHPFNVVECGGEVATRRRAFVTTTTSSLYYDDDVAPIYGGGCDGGMEEVGGAGTGVGGEGIMWKWSAGGS